MSDDLALPYEELWYIKLINETDKNPLETWGGYSQDFEAAENVYSHEEVLESDHENWGIVGIKGDDRYLLIFDLDVHKAPDGFDVDSVNVPTDAPIVRSQSGGQHVYFIVKDLDGPGKESDFAMAYNLGWDIDIRGSYVKQHVVAPADIPGTGGLYDLVNDERPPTYHNPTDPAERVRYLGDDESEKDWGEALLEHNPGRGHGYDGGIPIGRDVEPPEEMPTCYHRALQIREANPDDPNVNIHKTNVFAGLCGLAAGYSLEDLVTHFCDDYAPGPNGDREKTRYQLEHLLDGDYSPPSIASLREYGILDEDETCSCPIEYHGDGPDDSASLVVTLPENPKQRTGFGPVSAQTDERATDGPSISDVRSRVTGALNEAMAGREQVVVDAIMGGGKTYSAFAVAHARDEAILYTAGRKELYEQAQDYALEVGYDEDDIYVLPSPDECPAFNGEHGEQWKDRAWKLYKRGVHASTLHKLEDLPCCSDDGDGTAECPYEARNKFDPGEYDVIIGHYKHAHIPDISIGRHVVIDENPTAAFMSSIAGDALIEGVNAFLSLEDSPAVDGFDDLLATRHDPERREKALEWYTTGNGGQGFDFEPDEQNAVRFEERGYHAYAPHATYAILSGSPVGGAWDGHDGQRYPFERASFSGIGREARVYTTSDEFSRNGGDLYYVQIQTPPEIEDARSVVALDGTPLIDDWSAVAEATADGERVAEWEIALGRPLTRRRALTDDERAAFLRETMGHSYIQTSPHIRPYSSGKYHDPERDEALLSAASEEYLDGEPWDVAITAKKVADEYSDLGFTNDERKLVETIDHWGNVRGSDEYGECRSGAILGSAHHGDHEVARRAAWLGEQIHPEGKGEERTYGPAGDAVVEQMRDLATAQTSLRIGRGEGGRGAIVLLDTCAYPDWLPVVNPGAPADVSLWRDSDRDVREAVGEILQRDDQEDVDGVLRAEVAEVVDGYSERTIQRALARHAERGLLEKTSDPRDGRRTLWVDTGLTQQAQAVTVSIPDLDRDTASDFHDSCRIEHYTRTVVKNSADGEGEADTLELGTVLSDGGVAREVCLLGEIRAVSQPGGLALTPEEITADVLGGEKLEPPGGG